MSLLGNALLMLASLMVVASLSLILQGRIFAAGTLLTFVAFTIYIRETRT